MSRIPLPLIGGAVVVAALLVWAGISVFKTDPTPAAAVPAVPSNVAPVVRDEPLPKPATETADTKSVESEAQKQSAASPSPINEVIPDPSRGARNTIRGTIRVSIRVIVAKDGTVVAATADEPGPSRYFERLAVEAAKKWTFAPADSAEQRVMLVRFYYKRTGTTARAIRLQDR